jgi:hypothetical protein
MSRESAKYSAPLHHVKADPGMALLKCGSNRSVEAGSAVGTGNPVDGDAVTVVERPLATARAGEDLHLMAAGAKHPR